MYKQVLEVHIGSLTILRVCMSPFKFVTAFGQISFDLSPFWIVAVVTIDNTSIKQPCTCDL